MCVCVRACVNSRELRSGLDKGGGLETGREEQTQGDVHRRTSDVFPGRWEGTARATGMMMTLGGQILDWKSYNCCAVKTSKNLLSGWSAFLEGEVKVTHSVVSDSLQPHELYSPWNSPGQNAGVGSNSLLQGIFPSQGSNSGLPHCSQIFLPAEPPGRW